MCFSFAGIWKKYFLRSLTLWAIGAKTRFFKMWLKSTHDQKLEIFYSLRPEDGLHGSNETKKCEIRPVVSSIVHFKVFKSYFICIIDLRRQCIPFWVPKGQQKGRWWPICSVNAWPSNPLFIITSVDFVMPVNCTKKWEVQSELLNTVWLVLLTGAMFIHIKYHALILHSMVSTLILSLTNGGAFLRQNMILCKSGFFKSWNKPIVRNLRLKNDAIFI